MGGDDAGGLIRRQLVAPTAGLAATEEALTQMLRRLLKSFFLFLLPQSSEASPVASENSSAYQLIARTVRELFPGVVVAPGLMIGGTDSRHMIALADNVYRFSPVRARAEDLARFHGTDERISVDNYVELIRFYQTLLRHAAGG